MKARIKETGEIVEVNQCSILYDDGRRELMYGKELEEVQGAPDYWTRLEHTYAGMAMQQLVTLVNVGYEYVYEETAIIASNFAHALVQKMKEERK